VPRSRTPSGETDGQFADLSVKRMGVPPLAGGDARHLANVSPEKIFHFAWSHEGRQVALVGGNQSHDVVLIRRFR